MVSERLLRPLARKRLLLLVLLWFLLEPDGRREPVTQLWLGRAERRLVWRKALQTRKYPAWNIFPGDWRIVLANLLVQGCVESHPGPMGETQGKMTRWTWDNLKWAFDYAVVTRPRMGENHFDEVGKSLVKLFQPGSSGSIQTVQLVAKIACGGDDIGTFRTSLGSAVPTEATEVNDSVKVNTLRACLEQLVPKGARTDRDYLAKVVKTKDESWLSFVERFYASAQMYPDLSRLDKVRLFYSRLSKELRDVVAQMSPEAQLDTLVNAVTQKLQWEHILHAETLPAGGLTGGGLRGDPMDLDSLHTTGGVAMEQCHALRDKLIDSTNQKLVHSAITSDNGVMCAWKYLMRNKGYRAEAEKFLRTLDTQRGSSVPLSKRQVGKVWRAMTTEERVDDGCESEGEGPDWEECPHQLSMSMDEPAENSGEGFIDTLEECPDSKIILETRQVPQPITCRTVAAHPASVSVPISIQGSKGGVKAHALIDTGASHNFVQHSLVKKIGKEEDILPCSRSVTYGNGYQEPLVGSITLQSMINGTPHSVECFVIRGKGPQMILGYGFLAVNHLLVDCFGKSLCRQDSQGRIVRCSLLQTDVQQELQQLQRKLEAIQCQLTALTGKNCQG